MSFEIPLPNIRSTTIEGQMTESQEYLYQLAEYLKWALNSMTGIDNGNADGGSMVLKSGGKDLTEEDAKSAFSAIKGLIINSAEIIEAYEQEMKITLGGSSRHINTGIGEYIEERSAEILADSQGIVINNFKNAGIDAQMVDDNEAKKYTEVKQHNAYIKAGYLDEENGTYIYGLEIGENGRKCATFTTNKLSFYADNQEVAYISNNKLYINYAQLNNELKVGGYVISPDNGGLAFLWKGV